jgi:uncharacterized protein YbbC (DUF1343 family)
MIKRIQSPLNLFAGLFIVTLFAIAFSPTQILADGGQNRLEVSDDWQPPVMSGLDVLESENFARLKGRKIGLITNHSGTDRDGNHIIDLMTNAKLNIVALFSPEHGIRGTEDRHVDSSVDEKTGLKIYSLYGKTREPSDEMLEGIDTIVFDLQDIGARFYTYIATMGICMEKAKEKGLKFVVLDRPNPIQGTWFDGPIQDDDLVGKFTAFRHMPVAHGMTTGEMALFYNKYSGRMQDKPGIACDLDVVAMKGWERSMYYDETGLPWVNPSPNMRSVNQELLYTMVALTESNKVVSVGRGTERPFEYIGAPWIDGKALAMDLRSRHLPGIWVMQTTFMPRKIDVSGRENYPYQFNEEVCQGARFVVSDRDAVSPVAAGIVMLDALKKYGGEKYMENFDQMRGLVGAKWVLDDIKAGKTPDSIVEKWRKAPEFKAFANARASVLLYK